MNCLANSFAAFALFLVVMLFELSKSRTVNVNTTFTVTETKK